MASKVARPITLHVNGRDHVVTVPPDTALLHVLRNDLHLNGPKFGCGLGQCGACTVLVDGMEARACALPVRIAERRSVVTLEGLAVAGRPGAVQQAFIDHQAAQCGYCLNGMIMTVTALLRRNPHPSEADAREALRYNLCRCGTHVEILAAVADLTGAPPREPGR
ncbi:(2Fe-2S)-binding protein [Aureimonas glaciei]|uniref:Oxidoreductase n=1 Tax=Aureimonas glaciei TaxID=1776957 RepID=A0A917DBL7_9HYPH|nr:(2Fe-2S)-binding protein [Aureimonas glaciei]GGD22969.1 oxidoreductase [Aureimonas glaciei]